MGEGIAYQNKDIISKVFSERLQGNSIKVYGIDIPRVKQALPTNIPQIQANELRMDNVFLLEDDTLAIIDYESKYDVRDKNKYIRYINHVAAHYGEEFGNIPRIRMIVIYTADVTRESVDTGYDLGCIHLNIEAAFLSEINGPKVYEDLYRKIISGEELTGEEKMRLIILPLTYKGKDAKRKAIDRCVDLAMKIENEDDKAFVLLGLLVYTDKIIKEKQANRIRRTVGMTKVGAIIAREIEESWEKGMEKGMEKGVKLLIENALKNGKTAEEVASFVNVPIEKVKEVRREMLQEA